jgi:hypothetical protein
MSQKHQRPLTALLLQVLLVHDSTGEGCQCSAVARAA